MTKLKLPPDLGGVFDSDAHRRVLGHLRAPHDDGDGACEAGAPMAVQAGGWERSLLERLALDPHFTGADKVDAILKDLESDGYVEERPEGYIMTPEGFDALNGSNGNEAPPMTPGVVAAMHSDGTLTDDEVEAWSQATGMELE